jgi:arylsulfatase A-like enzyme
MLTGQYSWRRDVPGLNKGVAEGGSPLLIPTDMPTAPGLLKAAGYQTAVIGKWHLGFGESKPNFNIELRPGPLEIGFHEYFGLPATNDRIPTVLIRDHKVIGLDPNDPIEYTYNKEEAKERGLSPFAAGRNRIGFAKGGKAAWWKDTELADTFTRESVEFVERNKEKPFFLFFAPHDVHAPIIPHPRFVGKSGVSLRADMLMELDWSVGQLLDTLEKHGLAKNTLVIFSSDNGPVWYPQDERRFEHESNGPLRGMKIDLWEGAHRVPFLVRWPGHVPANTVRDELFCFTDVLATCAAVLGRELPEGAGEDSVNQWPVWQNDATEQPQRESLIIERRMVRHQQWKLIRGNPNGGLTRFADPKPEVPASQVLLFDLQSDLGETTNVADQHPEQVERMLQMLQDAI